MIDDDRNEAQKRADRELRLAEQAAEFSLRRLEQARQMAEVAATIPSEPKRGSVIKFTVQFAEQGQVYTYVAHRAPNGQWYRVGEKESQSWEELTSFMLRDYTSKREGISFFLYGKEGKWQGRKP